MLEHGQTTTGDPLRSIPLSAGFCPVGPWYHLEIISGATFLVSVTSRSEYSVSTHNLLWSPT